MIANVSVSLLRKLCEDVFCDAVSERPAEVVHLLEFDAGHDEQEPYKGVEPAPPVCRDGLADAAGRDEGAPDVDPEVREHGCCAVEEETPKQVCRLVV